MSAKTFFKELSENIQIGANIKKVYGEAVNTQAKTIIPVAQVAYGYGGGFGSKKKKQNPESGENPSKEGGGIGVGVYVRPIGVLEVSPQKTTFVPINPYQEKAKNFLIGIITGVVVSFWLNRKRTKKRKRKQLLLENQD